MNELLAGVKLEDKNTQIYCYCCGEIVSSKIKDENFLFDAFAICKKCFEQLDLTLKKFYTTLN